MLDAYNSLKKNRINAEGPFKHFLNAIFRASQAHPELVEFKGVANTPEAC